MFYKSIFLTDARDRDSAATNYIFNLFIIIFFMIRCIDGDGDRGGGGGHRPVRPQAELGCVGVDT